LHAALQMIGARRLRDVRLISGSYETSVSTCRAKQRAVVTHTPYRIS